MVSSPALNFEDKTIYLHVFSRVFSVLTRECWEGGSRLVTNISFHILCIYYSPFILIIAQRDATQNSLFIIPQVHCTYFGCQPHPSSRVHKTVTTAPATVQLPPSKLAWPRWRKEAAQKIWPGPEAVVTVLCTPDDGFGWDPKHVEWTCRIKK